MDALDEIIDAVEEASPKFNQNLLIDYPRRQIESAAAFIDDTWRGAVKLVSGAFTYDGYDIVPPEERARTEMYNRNKNYRTLSGTISELTLMRCKFTHDRETYTWDIYVPYLVDRTLFIRGKRMSLILGINERVFSRVIEKNRNGIMIRPIRVPLRFNRADTIWVESITSDFRYHEFVTIGYLHSKPSTKRNMETSVILYLLTKFGFQYTTQRLGFGPDDFSFVANVDTKTLSEYEYFEVKKIHKRSPDAIYLKATKAVCQTELGRKYIANLVYTLGYFDFQTIDDLYEPDRSVYRTMLGRLTSSATFDLAARNSADQHIESVDLLLDDVTRKRFAAFIPNIGNDIYDVLFYIFVHIDRIMTNDVVQNLYNKRIDVSVGILIEAYAKAIYDRMYLSNQKHTLRAREVKQLLSPSPWAIDRAINSSKKDGSRSINSSPTISNDSWLSSCGVYKNRHDGSPKLRFDPSMVFAESIVAFTGKNIGRSGYINPFMVIDSNGGIVRQDYCDDIDSIRPFLPN